MKLSQYFCAVTKIGAMESNEIWSYRRELENRLKAPNAQERDKVAQNAALKEFADAAGEQLRSLRTEANRCRALYEECAEFYGESAKTVDANTFFGYLVSLVLTDVSAG